MAVFAALSHLSSQLLITALRHDVVCAMAHWQESERRNAWRHRKGAVRIACLCGSCSWHIPLSRLTICDAASSRSSRVVACTRNAQSADLGRCPNGGDCESYLRWLRARFGIDANCMRFLLLTPGEAAEFADNDSKGSLIRGVHIQAEPCKEGKEKEDQRVRIQRYRCRSCQVLTHAEVLGGESEYVALVTTYEKLRWKSFDSLHGLQQAASVSDDHVSACPPPSCFRDTRMEEVVLPRTSFGQREGACYL
jgi:hypothetical protein